MKVNENDLFNICSLIESVSRKSGNSKADIVDTLGEKKLRRLYRFANINHCLPIEQVTQEVIEDNQIVCQEKICRSRNDISLSFLIANHSHSSYLQSIFDIYDQNPIRIACDSEKSFLAAIAREMNFWYDVSLKTDSNITKEEAENKIIGLHEAYFDIKGNKGHASLVAGIDEEAGDVDSMYQLVLQRKGNLSAIEDEMDGK